MFTVRHYITEDEHDPFQEWLKKLRDPIAKGQVVRRVGRIEAGNFGDHKPCREGVWELRIDQGPGYRVYYGVEQAVVSSTAISITADQAGYSCPGRTAHMG
ncbi:type II toxin-antitoxin system RelE/ParE family toxin [Diaphorobacter sp. JS3051]|uniref:type II toxin-antitoxin system RelE/ParE family toxin n=1 Tax=Diaphorobacter sp. JS3051 TaxID=2792224 RepID=UPI001E2DB689|nr:type II toxin-antitoxin system RelE/ParE family toxin [Diaphorobacter sp. JS3051]